jgi:DMSO/TMAO reductase YedYZ heme-binding membrane subunit
MLGMHRFIAALTVTFVVLHVLALLTDDFIGFGVADVLVPFASPWRPLAVAIGVVAFYLVVAIEATSVAQRRLPRPLWRQVHLLSYALFALATIHGLAAGTDTAALFAGGAAIGVGTVAALLGVLGWVARSEPKEESATRPLTARR